MHKFEWHVYATQSVSATIMFKEIEILHGNNYALHLMNIAIHVAKEKVILFVINAMIGCCADTITFLLILAFLLKKLWDEGWD